MEDHNPTPRRFAHYELAEEIGRGGMGVVYRARDTRLGRPVAIKVLPARVASDPERRARFVREARAAARLNHPAIATVYEVGETRVEDPSLLGDSELADPDPREVVYIAMEYVEGQDLGPLLEQGLTLRETLDYGIQIAEGLAAAHERGVIHRDLKPGNVRITPQGRVKILDFGLAKTLREATGLEMPVDPTLTAHGGIVGTVPYMAPEQLQGTDVDARSDLFSFGVVLYQMLTGRVPFGGGRLVDYVKALADRRPEPPSKSNPAISPALEGLVEQLLAREPEDRVASAGEVAGQLKVIARSRPPSDSKPTLLPPPRDSLFSEISRSWPGRHWAAALLAGLLLLAVVGGVWLKGRQAAEAPVRNVAVLPFENRTSDPNLTAYYEGIGSFLTLKLSKVRGINVESELAMRRFRGTAKPPEDIARELGVGTLLMGHVQGDAEWVRVVVQMLDTETGTILWFDEVEGGGRPAALLEVQEEVADRVLEKLAVGLSAAERSRLRRNPTPVSEAYDAYLEGMRLLEEVSDPAAARDAERLFERALAADAEFSWAHGGLSRALLRRYDLERDPALLSRAAEEADRAVALEPDLPQLLVLRAKVSRVQGRSGEALEDIEAALQINPEIDFLYRELAFVYVQQNRIDLAEEAYRRAAEQRPLSWFNWNELGGFLLKQGRFDEARPGLEKAVKLAPEHAIWPLENLGTLEYFTGNLDEALATYGRIEPADRTSSILTNMGGAAFAQGHLGRAEAYFRSAIEKQPAEPVHWLNLGDTLSTTGRLEDAREIYAQGLRRVEEQLESNAESPRLRSLRVLLLAKSGDCPRATALVKELRLELGGSIPELRRLAKSAGICQQRDLTLVVIKDLLRSGDAPDGLRAVPELSWLVGDLDFGRLSLDDL